MMVLIVSSSSSSSSYFYLPLSLSLFQRKDSANRCLLFLPCHLLLVMIHFISRFSVPKCVWMEDREAKSTKIFAFPRCSSSCREEFIG